MAKITVSDSIKKLIRHNLYLANKYNKDVKNPNMVRLEIRNITDYKKLLKSGKTKKELYSILVKEKHSLEVPKSLEKIRRQINRARKQNDYTGTNFNGKVTSGGYYYGLKEYGYKEQLRRARSDLKRARGYALPINVQHLMDELLTFKGNYELLMKKSFTSEENNEFNGVLARLKRNMYKFPDKLIKPLYDAGYDLKNAVSDPLDFTTYANLLMGANGVY